MVFIVEAVWSNCDVGGKLFLTETTAVTRVNALTVAPCREYERKIAF
jgi:hypothetical protein